MKTSNPVLGKKIFENYTYDSSATGVMTVQGTVNKIALMLILVVAAASFTWGQILSGAGGQGLMLTGGIGGFVVALITVFNKKRSSVLAPIYAVLEGLFLGGISAFFESMYPGLVMRAIVLTFAVLFAMLFAYKTQMIKVTQKFRTGVLAATMGIGVAYLLSFLLRIFGVDTTFMFGGGTMGIVISLVIVAVAALNLVLDFDFIEKGAQAQLPKYFEWYGAFGLMVTLIWLYIEILRLLSYLSGRD